MTATDDPGHVEGSVLRRILAPRSVAVVGAGRRRGSAGHETLCALRDYGFQGRLHAVNGSGRPVCGVLAHRAVTDLPGPIDLLVVAVAAEDVAPVLTCAGRLGVRGAVLLGTGPRGGEPRGDQQRREILRVARRQGIRLLGPACLGILNTDPRVRLNASLSPSRPPSGGLAVAVRSGAVGIALLAEAVRGHCGISSFISLGDEIDITGSDLLGYWLDDPATRAVALSPEAFSDPVRFARAAGALGRRKPVLAITGAPDATREVLLAEAGVIRTTSLSETLDTARILVDQPLPAGNRMAIVGNAGGLTALAAGSARTHGFEVVPLSGPTRAQLPSAAGRDGLGNPVDLDIDALPARIADATETVVHSGEIDILLLVLVSTRANVLAASLSALAPVLDDHPHLTKAAVIVGGTADVHQVGRHDVPVFHEPEQAVRALAHARDYAAWRRYPPNRRAGVPAPKEHGVTLDVPLCGHRQERGPMALSSARGRGDACLDAHRMSTRTAHDLLAPRRLVMNAHIGDRLVLEGRHLGDGRRTAVITALHHPDGSPPYEVRWLDDGRTTLIFPGPEAHIEPATHPKPETTGSTP